MATEKGMSGVDLAAVIAEIEPHLPLWVDKCYQAEGGIFVIRLNGREHTRHLLLVEPGRRVHFATIVPAFPKVPPPFAMVLRKFLAGGRVLSLSQPGLSRILTMDIQKSSQMYRLVIEVFDAGNIIICDQEFRIIRALRPHRFRERDVIAGEVYQYPGKDLSYAPPEEWTAHLKVQEREVVKVLATDAMLGGAYAEQVCSLAGVDKNLPARDADAPALHAALTRLLDHVRRDSQPSAGKGGAHPIPLPGFKGEPFPTFQAALEAYYPVIPKKAVEQKGKVTRDEIIRKRQEAAVKKYDEKAAKSESAAEAIYSHYTLVHGVTETLNTAQTRYSWQEIASILKKGDGVAKLIKTVHPEEASVDLDLDGFLVRIHVRDSIEQNVGRYYEQAKKFRKKREGAIAAMNRPVPVRKKAARRTAPMKKRWFHRFRWFYTTDGVLVLGGRDAGQNEDLVKKYMEGRDRFLHADVHGASVVIVKGATEKMDEVARFAAVFSGAWRAGHHTADVYAVRPDQVSKTPESGEFVVRGSFIVRGEREYFRNVPLRTAIGLLREPEMAVIGGPPDVIRKRAFTSLEIQPGTFEPNDIAKKLTKVFKDRIPEQERAGWRNVLTTEAVAAFVPPGGSDLVDES